MFTRLLKLLSEGETPASQEATRGEPASQEETSPCQEQIEASQEAIESFGRTLGAGPGCTCCILAIMPLTLGFSHLAL